MNTLLNDLIDRFKRSIIDFKNCTNKTYSFQNYCPRYKRYRISISLIGIDLNKVKELSSLLEHNKSLYKSKNIRINLEIGASLTFFDEVLNCIKRGETLVCIIFTLREDLILNSKKMIYTISYLIDTKYRIYDYIPVSIEEQLYYTKLLINFNPEFSKKATICSHIIDDHNLLEDPITVEMRTKILNLQAKYNSLE